MSDTTIVAVISAAVSLVRLTCNLIEKQSEPQELLR
jgi:hypothetical protein